jgi:acyl-homoserine lactone acylase PvdQ
MQTVESGDHIIPMGQSGNPLSQHYSDLLGKWRDGKYVKIQSTTPCVFGQKNCLILHF